MLRTTDWQKALESMGCRLYPHDHGYLVYDVGLVWSVKRKMYLIGGKDRYGYYRFTLSTKGKPVYKTLHQMVLETFVGDKPTGKVARHLDGDKLNNWIGNLEWGTVQDNHKDMKKHHKEGKTNIPNSGFSEEDVRKIRQLRKDGLYNRTIASMYGVDVSTISRLTSGKTWDWIC